MKNLLVKLFRNFFEKSPDLSQFPLPPPPLENENIGTTLSQITSKMGGTDLVPVRTRSNGKLGWHYDEEGRIYLYGAWDFAEKHNLRWLEFHKGPTGDEYVRSRGEPKTVTNLRNDFGLEIADAAKEFDLPYAWIAAMITIEAARKGGHYDPVSRRHEPGYTSDEETPHRVSGGLMQTLLTTARDMSRKYRDRLRKYDVPKKPKFKHLTNPLFSCLLGAAYMRFQIDRGHHPRRPVDDEMSKDLVLLCGSYNAGSLRPSSDTPWNILTYGQFRLIKMVAYHNDWVDTFGEGYTDGI